MKTDTMKMKTVTAAPATCRASLLVSALAILVCVTSLAKENGSRTEHYVQVNLVSDLPGVALLQDTNLVNAWGVSFSRSSPFWVSDNGTGKSTLYAVTN